MLSSLTLGVSTKHFASWYRKPSSTAMFKWICINSKQNTTVLTFPKFYYYNLLYNHHFYLFCKVNRCLYLKKNTYSFRFSKVITTIIIFTLAIKFFIHVSSVLLYIHTRADYNVEDTIAFKMVGENEWENYPAKTGPRCKFLS